MGGRNPVQTAICKTCGGAFLAQRGNVLRGRGRFCSRHCAAVGKIAERRQIVVQRAAGPAKSEGQPGDVGDSSVDSLGRRLVPRPPRSKAMVDRRCEACGATFRVEAYRVRRGQGRFCSKQCSGRAKWPAGIAHPLFKHGQSRSKPHAMQAAHQAVRNAVVAGRVQPTPCAQCGSNKRVQAHHEDYSKPLEVTWLCEACHKALHAEKRRMSA